MDEQVVSAMRYRELLARVRGVFEARTNDMTSRDRNHLGASRDKVSREAARGVIDRVSAKWRTVHAKNS